VADAAAKKAKKAKEELSSFAVRYLEDVIFELMLDNGQAAKSRELATVLEATLKLGPKFIRKALYYSPRFDLEDRRWNLALRTATNLPFEGSIENALRSYGKPLTQAALHNEMALIHRRPVDFFDSLLTETLTSRAKYWQAPDGAWALREWILDLSDSDPERCFLRNFFLEAAQLRPIVDALTDTRMSHDQAPVEMAVKLIRKHEEPVPNKLLAYAVWKLRDGDLDPVQFFQDCRTESRLLLMSGPTWGLQEFVPGFEDELKKLAKKAEREADVEWAEEEEPEGPIIVSPADLEEVYKLIKRRKKAQPARALAESIFEYGPSSRRFPESVDALMSSMSLDPRFIRVGSQTWTLPDLMPKHTEKVPAALLPVPVPVREDETDAELDDEGLENVLVAWVHDPRYEDFGEEPEIDITSDQQPTDELRYILLHDHWKAGTLKVRVSDRRFFPSESDLVCATFLDKEKNKAYPVWLSYATSLLYEINDWYADRKLLPGAIFAVTPGSVPDEFYVSYEEDIDPLTALTEDRIKELGKIKRELTAEATIFDIMQRVMAGHAKGCSFMTVWAEVNVIRRTTRRVVASNLASYHCFFQKPANSDTWLFDERKVSQGRKKTKRKYLRGVSQ
jgi:DNA-directed RNA polymerase delta subunit